MQLQAIMRLCNSNYKIEVDSQKTEAGFKIGKVKNLKNRSNVVKNLWN